MCVRKVVTAQVLLQIRMTLNSLANTQAVYCFIFLLRWSPSTSHRRHCRHSHAFYSHLLCIFIKKYTSCARSCMLLSEYELYRHATVGRSNSSTNVFVIIKPAKAFHSILNSTWTNIPTECGMCLCGTQNTANVLQHHHSTANIFAICELAVPNQFSGQSTHEPAAILASSAAVNASHHRRYHHCITIAEKKVVCGSIFTLPVIFTYIISINADVFQRLTHITCISHYFRIFNLTPTLPAFSSIYVYRFFCSMHFPLSHLPSSISNQRPRRTHSGSSLRRIEENPDTMARAYKK